MTKYIFLIGAIVLEVAGTMMLPLTNNFSKLLPTLALGIFYLGSFYLLTFAIKFIPLSIVYATWSGVGVFLVAILSYFFYGDVLKWPAILGLCFIVVGVMLVNLFGVSRL
ncbi:MAG TPA: QacE family quaternary ammonium compound efflux SMR transporter [Bacteroidetes bacterium]|nr:QacE family quaternary ammonium compound efflux SMR transporter [Bacteroidota bacterium]